MIARALILAAGKGVSIGGRAELPNCLTTVGRCSVHRADAGAARGAWASRADRHHGRLRGRRRSPAHRRVDGAVARRPSGASTFFENADWHGPNGLSVLAARSFVTERTLLVMADQIAAPGAGARDVRRMPAARRPHGAGRRSRSVARVRHRRRHQGEAGAASASPRSASSCASYDAVSAGLFVMRRR